MPSNPSDQVAITGCGWVTPECSGSIDQVLRALKRNPDDPLQIDAPYWAVSHEPLKAHPGLSNEL
ncbi:MAG: hypothetical protein ACE5GE_10825, partial [Phycisphaerae bacterium]